MEANHKEKDSKAENQAGIHESETKFSEIGDDAEIGEEYNTGKEIMVVERDRKFEFGPYVMRYSSRRILNCYMELLEQFNSNKPQLNHYIGCYIRRLQDMEPSQGHLLHQVCNCVFLKI